MTLDELDFKDPLVWNGARDPQDVVRVRKGQLMEHAGAIGSAAALIKQE